MRKAEKYKSILLLATLLTCTTTCAQKQSGIASYYSKQATGARTSNGERLHHDSLTCAHRTFPFGTILKVTNLSNGKTVFVRVNDRGPFLRGRIIDLSWKAAKKIDMLTKGITKVTVEPVDGMITPFRPDVWEAPELNFGHPEFYFTIPSDWREMSGLDDDKENHDDEVMPPILLDDDLMEQKR